MANKTVTMSRELAEQWLIDLEGCTAFVVAGQLRALLAAPVVERQAGCCCPPKGYSGIWAGAMCPVHQGLRSLKPSQPAPVSVSLPTSADFAPVVESIYGVKPTQLCLLDCHDLERIWNACLDKVKEMNNG